MNSWDRLLDLNLANRKVEICSPAGRQPQTILYGDYTSRNTYGIRTADGHEYNLQTEQVQLAFVEGSVSIEDPMHNMVFVITA